MAYQIVDAEYVMEHKDDMPVVDVRSYEMYCKGHVPGAINIPFDVVKNGSVGSSGADSSVPLARAMAVRFKDSGIFPWTQVIIMCQTGYHALKTCEMLGSQGYDKLMLYEGSYQDWVSVPTRPSDTELAFAS